MGGLVSAKIAERTGGRVQGALNLCGLVAGGVDLNNYQLNAEHALAALLAPGEEIRLVDFADPASATASGARLTELVRAAQATAPGRARIALAAALLNLPDWYPGRTRPAARDYSAQQEQEYQWLTGGGVLNFVQSGRYSIEQAAGGDSAWNAGLDHARLLRESARLPQVRALYRAAGLSLGADLTALDRGADVRADHAALGWMRRTSEPTGRLRVPVLDVHNVSDQLVPVEQESRFAGRVVAAGARGLLRQAYVERPSHCAFTPAETVAAVHAVRHRIRTGRWDDVTTAGDLNRAGGRLGLGDTAFVAYHPARLVTQSRAPRRPG
jgi:hypothetical protein